MSFPHLYSLEKQLQDGKNDHKVSLKQKIDYEPIGLDRTDLCLALGRKFDKYLAYKYLQHSLAGGQLCTPGGTAVGRFLLSVWADSKLDFEIANGDLMSYC